MQGSSQVNTWKQRSTINTYTSGSQISGLGGALQAAWPSPAGWIASACRVASMAGSSRQDWAGMQGHSVVGSGMQGCLMTRFGKQDQASAQVVPWPDLTQGLSRCMVLEQCMGGLCSWICYRLTLRAVFPAEQPCITHLARGTDRLSTSDA